LLLRSWAALATPVLGASALVHQSTGRPCSSPHPPRQRSVADGSAHRGAVHLSAMVLIVTYPQVSTGCGQHVGGSSSSRGQYIVFSQAQKRVRSRFLGGEAGRNPCWDVTENPARSIGGGNDALGRILLLSYAPLFFSCLMGADYDRLRRTVVLPSSLQPFIRPAASLCRTTGCGV
jgi:hypothetical protein